MTYPAKTLCVFGVYLLGLGLTLVFVPNLVLGAFGVPLSSEVWIRVVGMLVLFLGIIDIVAARGEWAAFFRLSVPLRGSVILFFGAFVAFAGAPAMLLLFGSADFLFALWTAQALRQGYAAATGRNGSAASGVSQD